MSSRKNVDKLNQIDLVRKPFDELLQESVKEVFENIFPPENRQSLLEIGVGTGKLLKWLGDDWKNKILFTEPDQKAAEQFCEQFSQTCVDACAEKLPSNNDSLNGIISLCVMDIVKDQASVAKEAARCLKPGGIFLHILDMSVNYNFILRELKAHQLIPLMPPPLTEAQLWQQDLILCDQTQFANLCELMARQNHPDHQILAEYLEKLRTTTENTKAFMEHLESEPSKNSFFQRAFSNTIRWLENKGIQLDEMLSLFPASSLELFSQALETQFSDKFEIVHNDLKTNERVAYNQKSLYESLCCGTRFQQPINEENKKIDLLFPSKLVQNLHKCELQQTAIHVFCARKK